MKKIFPAALALLLCLAAFVVPAVAQGEVTVLPDTIGGSVRPGEAVEGTIRVTIPENQPKGDVVFVFDSTNTMRDIMAEMKEKGILIMQDIQGTFSDTRFGVGSFMDYPDTYTDYYGYTMAYGDASYGDYPWKADLDLTTSIDEAAKAIEAIPIGSGGDGPQDYARVIFESQFYSWRQDAKKVLVIFGDGAPHAAPSGFSLTKPWSSTGEKLFIYPNAPYGGDPGRNGIAEDNDGTVGGDDLDYGPVVAGIAGQHITIVGVYCALGSSKLDAESNFQYLAYMTNGVSMTANSPDISGQIVELIRQIATRNMKVLTLQAEEGYAGWVTQTPVEYAEVPWPSEKEFAVKIAPPEGTKEGDYTFPLRVMGDGVLLGTVSVNLHVEKDPDTQPIPVPVDIKPGSCPNSFNVKEKGIVTVAVLGTKELKAFTIDPKSIALTRDGSSGEVRPAWWSYDFVSAPSTGTCSCGYMSRKDDRRLDLVLKFRAQDMVEKLGLAKGEGCIELSLTGNLRSRDPKVAGELIAGTDSIRVIRAGQGGCGKDDGKDGRGSPKDMGGCWDRDSPEDKGSCDDGDSGDTEDPWDDDRGHGR